VNRLAESSLNFRRRLDSCDDFAYIAVEMKNSRILGGFESLLLLATLRLGEKAYGVTIRQELLERAQKDVAVGAIYTGLDRLEQKGFVESWIGEPTAERGGRAKRFYRVTASGLKAFNDTQHAIQDMLSGLDFQQEDAYA
jgi:DNA-binding PadR family transcriptional regulator